MMAAERDPEATATEIAAEWGVRLGPRIPSKHSYIAAVGADAILKIVRPDIPEYEHEAGALRLWNGDHAVRLLRRDRARRALLLERLVPGIDLSHISEGEAMRAAIEVGRALWVTPPTDHPFRSVMSLCSHWLDELLGQGEPLVRRARSLLDAMTLPREVLIHGDLHHHNILRGSRGWIAIDAQPAIGEAEYDVVTLLWNPVGTTPTKERTERWMRVFRDAGLDTHRVRDWAVVRGTILSFSSRSGLRHEPQLSVVRSLLSDGTRAQGGGSGGAMSGGVRDPDPPTRCWLDPRVHVGPSRIEGLGLFAAALIHEGELVAVLGGRVIDDDELRRVSRSRRKYNSAAIGERLNLLLANDEQVARGNHSCDPNLWMRDAYSLEARRDIASGEEITVDYALLTGMSEWEMDCVCGSPLCRKVVRGTDWMRPELQERYRVHFSPFINDRIKAAAES